MRPGLVVGLWVGLLASSCVPTTQYRRSALVPAPAVPPWHGEPLGATNAELGVQLGGRSVNERTAPQVGDPALWVPLFEVNATVMGGITDWFDLGGLVMYSHAELAAANAAGTPPLPGEANDVWGLGPQLGFGGRFLDDKLFAGGYVSLMYVAIPWSSWELMPDGEYRLVDSGYDQDLMYRVAMFFGGRPFPLLALYAGLVVTSAWVNDGFSDVEAAGSTLEQTPPALLPLLGASLDFAPEVPLYLRATLTFPISADEADFLPVGWDASIGVRL